MSYEVWGEPDEAPECPSCEENLGTVDELAMLVKRLVHALNKATPGNDIGKKAMEYLAHNTTIDSSPLRDADASPLLPQQGGEKTDEVAQILWHRFAPDHHVEWADETNKAEYHDTAAAIINAVNSVWRGLSDSQWVNIVNHDRAYENYITDDAVHLAVKMTEQRLKDNNHAAVLPQVGEAKGAVIERLECNVALLKEALSAICNDAEATYNAAKSGKPLEISIGQWGRLQRAKTRIGAAPASLREAKAVALIYFIGDSGDVWKETTKSNYDIWIGRKRIMYTAPVAQALPVAPKPCDHANSVPHYDHSTCPDCGGFKTDSDPEWGSGRNKWFPNKEQAKFFAKNGFLPAGLQGEKA